jgi:hypothetical protein
LTESSLSLSSAYVFRWIRESDNDDRRDRVIVFGLLWEIGVELVFLLIMIELFKFLLY